MKNLLLSLLFLMNSIVFAQIIDDNFDVETVGSLPTGWTIKYNGTGDANQKVVNTTSVSPDNSFELVSSSSLLAQIYKSFSTSLNKLSVDLYMKSENSLTGQTGYFSLYNVSENDHLAIVEFKDGKIITYYHNGSASDIYELQDFVVNQWYHIKIETNLETRLYQIFIDGELVSGTFETTTVDEFPMSLVTLPNSVLIASGNGGANTMWFDDVKLYETQELVAYYPFSGNANDESSNANHGIVNGAVLTTDRHGAVDSAYYFDGVDDYIMCNTEVGPFGNHSRTISFWVKTDREPNSGSQQNTVLSYGGNIYDGGSRFEILINPKCRGIGVDVSSKYQTKDFDNSDNGWHHYAVVLDNSISDNLSDLLYYADGELLDTYCNTNGGDITINTLDEEVLNIGRLFYSGDHRYFRGSIDEIKIYNYALTEDEIKKEVKGLIAYYPFSGNANDYSGNEHHGTVYGATLTDDKDGIANSAYYFDGVDDYIDIGDWENGGPMSFTFWARWDALNSWSRIVDLGNGADDDNIIISNRFTNSEIFFGIYNGGIYRDVYVNTITTSQWDFYTATVDGDGVMTIYKNATQINQDTDGYTPNFLMRTNQYIGKSNFSADQYFNGAIDDLRIFDKTLSQQEITDIYNAGVLEVVNQEVENNKIYVYNNVLYMDDENTTIQGLFIYNTLGQQVFQSNNIMFPLNISFLQSGVYIMKSINQKGNIGTNRILVEE